MWKKKQVYSTVFFKSSDFILQLSTCLESSLDAPKLWCALLREHGTSSLSFLCSHQPHLLKHHVIDDIHGWLFMACGYQGRIPGHLSPKFLVMTWMWRFSMLAASGQAFAALLLLHIGLLPVRVVCGEVGTEQTDKWYGSFFSPTHYFTMYSCSYAPRAHI